VTTPARSVSIGQTYTFTFTDSAGYADLAVLDVLNRQHPTGRRVLFWFCSHQRIERYLYLMDDAGDSGHGAGSPIALSSGATLSNSQCRLSTMGSSASGSGHTLRPSKQDYREFGLAGGGFGDGPLSLG
jgi:hypothetical protein